MMKNYKINNIRAFAIITVVFGHSIILYSSELGIYEPDRAFIIMDYIKKYINIYQMPLFFSLSGYLFALTWKNKNVGAFFRDKVKRLIIPFFAIGMLWMIPLKMIIHYPSYQSVSYLGALYKLLNGSDMGHLWYLPILFLIFVIIYSIIKYLGNNKAIWTILLLTGIIINVFRTFIPSFELIYLSNIYQYIWSFIIGAVIFYYNLDRIPQYASVLITISALLCASYDIYKGSSITIISSILILLAIYSIVPDKQYYMLESVSNMSFGMYLFHSPLIYITFTFLKNAHPAIVIGLNFIVFGAISFILTSVIKKTPAKIIIGE